MDDQDSSIRQELKEARDYCDYFAGAYTTAASRILNRNGQLAILAVITAAITTLFAGGTAVAVQSGDTTDDTTTSQESIDEQEESDRSRLPISENIALWIATGGGVITTIATGCQKLPFASSENAKMYQNAAAGYRKAAWQARSTLTAKRLRG
ncbi:MAG: hypothetical protein H0T57_08570 [Rubrobacter sp.]|nr:hypothetical protein [Rubrobacter sp.]MDQ3639157.1 hypothetical protein [Actinomycetota bacterium]